MTTREDIVQEARTWIDTPFHHQGRRKGVGVDCIGLAAGVAKNVGIPVNDQTGYSQMPDGKQLQAALEAHCYRIPLSEALPGDIALFRIYKQPQHVAILTHIGMVHALVTNGKVVEHSFDEAWRKRLVAVYRIVGVE